MLVLSSDEKTPATLADLLVARRYEPSRFVVLSGVSSDHETIEDTTASEFSSASPQLNIIALQLNRPLLAS